MSAEFPQNNVNLEDIIYGSLQYSVVFRIDLECQIREISDFGHFKLHQNAYYLKKPVLSRCFLKLAHAPNRLSQILLRCTLWLIGSANPTFKGVSEINYLLHKL